MADNPVSWFLLMIFGLYFAFRFLRAVVREQERQRAERERACQEFFNETPLDKRNILMYNSRMKDGGSYEFYDD